MTAPVRVEKLMSLTADEFAASLARLGPSQNTAGDCRLFNLDGGTVTIGSAPVAGVTLGGLLTLPRANVTLTFEGSTESARAQFLKRFDLAFQRGGG